MVVYFVFDHCANGSSSSAHRDTSSQEAGNHATSTMVMALHSTVLIALVLLLGATVPCFAEEAPKQTFTCTAKTFNECLMEAPCSAWKRLGPKAYKLETKIIFRGNPVEGETISGGTMGDILETKCGKK